MSEPIPVGVVGVGHLGRHHARIYASMPEVAWVGIVDADPVRARAVAAEFGGEVVADVDRLASRARAVSVATPTVSHREIGERLLGSGIDVLIEKPIAASLAEADALIGAHRAAAMASRRIGLPRGAKGDTRRPQTQAQTARGRG